MEAKESFPREVLFELNLKELTVSYIKKGGFIVAQEQYESLV